MTSPLVTVCITCANRPDLLREALASVVSQTLRDFLVLVSDNGTDQSCQRVVEEFGDARIRYIQHRPPIGPYHNWRYALTTPATKYVAFLHDDDVWLPAHLEKAVTLMERHQHAGIYSCRCEHFGADTFSNPPLGLEEISTPTVFTSSRAALLWTASNLTQCSAVVLRRNLMSGLDWGTKNDMYAVDWFLWAQLAAQASWIYQPEVGVRYRVHAQSGTSRVAKISTAAGIHYSTRKVVSAFLPFIREDREAFLAAVSEWPTFYRSRIVVSLFHLGAGRELWSLGREICKRNPSILTDRNAIGHCRLAGRLGLGYLHFAEFIDRIRGWWWPQQAHWASVESPGGTVVSRSVPVKGKVAE